MAVGMTIEMLEMVRVSLAGAGVGLLSGIFGFGGGFLLVPVLNIFLGVPMNLAVGAGACQVLGPATTSILARRVKLEHLRFPVTILGGLGVGVFLGTHLFQLATQYERIELAGRSMAAADFLVLLMYLVLFLGVGLFSIWESRLSLRGRHVKKGWIAGWRIPPFATFPEFDRPKVSITVLTWFGLAVGFIAGFLGMSGGLILLPGLVYLLGMKTHQAVMSTLITVWLVALQATMAHAWYGHIDLKLVTALLLGGTIGARLGSEIGQKLAGRQLRHCFGWLLLFSASIVGFRLMQMGQ